MGIEAEWKIKVECNQDQVTQCLSMPCPDASRDRCHEAATIGTMQVPVSHCFIQREKRRILIAPSGRGGRMITLFAVSAWSLKF